METYDQSSFPAQNWVSCTDCRFWHSVLLTTDRLTVFTVSGVTKEPNSSTPQPMLSNSSPDGISAYGIRLTYPSGLPSNGFSNNCAFECEIETYANLMRILCEQVTKLKKLFEWQNSQLEEKNPVPITTEQTLTRAMSLIIFLASYPGWRTTWATLNLRNSTSRLRWTPPTLAWKLTQVIVVLDWAKNCNSKNSITAYLVQRGYCQVKTVGCRHDPVVWDDWPATEMHHVTVMSLALKRNHPRRDLIQLVATDNPEIRIKGRTPRLGYRCGPCCGDNCHHKRWSLQ